MHRGAQFHSVGVYIERQHGGSGAVCSWETGERVAKILAAAFGSGFLELHIEGIKRIDWT